jgi:hypothetical protein
MSCNGWSITRGVSFSLGTRLLYSVQPLADRKPPGQNRRAGEEQPGSVNRQRTSTMRLTTLDYSEWIRHLFDHPAEGPQWYYDVDAPFWAGLPALTLAYMTRLFETPVEATTDFSDAQINQGLWYLLSDASHDVLANVMLPKADRGRCIVAMGVLFREIFAPRCTPHLSHKSEMDAGALNGVCYMWWDILQLMPQPAQREQWELDVAAIEVMADALALDSVACQESALHGLGHWNTAYPEEIARIIDRYVERSAGARPDLITYAKSARTGCVL